MKADEEGGHEVVEAGSLGPRHEIDAPGFFPRVIPSEKSGEVLFHTFCELASVLAEVVHVGDAGDFRREENAHGVVEANGPPAVVLWPFGGVIVDAGIESGRPVVAGDFVEEDLVECFGSLFEALVEFFEEAVADGDSEAIVVGESASDFGADFDGGVIGEGSVEDGFDPGDSFESGKGFVEGFEDFDDDFLVAIFGCFFAIDDEGDSFAEPDADVGSASDVGLVLRDFLVGSEG